jgi:outer membrane protein
MFGKSRMGFLIFMAWALVTPAALAQSLNLDDVLQAAVAQSYTLKIAKTDIRLSQKDVQAARADYFPQVSANLNTGYQKDLATQQNSFTSVVGNQVLPTGSRFQNSVGFSVNQNLVDFGARSRKVQIAQKDVLSKVAQHDQGLRDLKLKLIELYTNALITHRSIQAHQQVLTLAQKSYQMKKRLYEAGTLSNVEVSTEALQVAQTLDQIETLKQQLAEHLQSLSYFTHEQYNQDDLQLADIAETVTPTEVTFDPTNTPEARIYEMELAKKQQEIELLKRQTLPQVSLYTSYYLYGANQDHWADSLKDMRQRMVSVGLSLQAPIFDGLKAKTAIDKARLEKEKLALQREEKLAALRHQVNVYTNQVDGSGVQLKTRATIVNQSQDKVQMLNRLSEQKVVDQVQPIKEQIDQIYKHLELEKTTIEGVAALKKLKIMAES